MSAWWKPKKGIATDKSQIVPVIKAQESGVHSSKVLHLSPEKTPIIEPFVNELVVMYAFDLPHVFQFLNAGDCQSLRLERENLRQLAVGNLIGRLPTIERRGEPPVFMLTAGGSLEASLLLVESIWQGQATIVPGEVVAAVPARDVLIFTGSESFEGIEAIKDSVERVWENGDHLLSKQLLIRHRNEWQPYY